jgi:hypothetical protein
MASFTDHSAIDLPATLTGTPNNRFDNLTRTFGQEKVTISGKFWNVRELLLPKKLQM